MYSYEEKFLYFKNLQLIPYIKKIQKTIYLKRIR